jgi:hypothetical protein
MAGKQPHNLKSISEYHQFRNLPRPQHPLISVINVDEIKRLQEDEPKSIIQQFYGIALKRMVNGQMKYGQQEYDFDEGILFFIAPGQVYSINAGDNFIHSGNTSTTN